MQTCPRCGEPDSAPTCRRCGYETAAGDPLAAAEEPAATARRGLSLWLLLVAGAVGFFVTLSIVTAAGLFGRPVVQPEPAGPTRPSRPPRSDAPAPAMVAPPPTWVGLRRAVWASDGSRSVTFQLEPVNDAPIWTPGGRPQLVARCLSRRTDVYVVTGPLSFEGDAGTHTVRVQVDDEPEQLQQWVDSESSQELFAPDGHALSDRLARAHRLRFGFTPFHARPVTLEFVVDGFDQLAPLLARTCGRRR